MSTATQHQHRTAHQRTADTAASGAKAKREGHAASMPADGDRKPPASSGNGHSNGNGYTTWFTVFAQKTAQLSGRPGTFLLAALVIVVWGITGPIFGYSDTWQLIINTGTTIVTFLMVFLIQNTQNRDTLAVQIKLDELIIALRGAHNRIAAAEDLCDEDLDALHEEYRRAAQTLDEMEEERRAAR